MVAKKYCSTAHFAESFQNLDKLRQSGKTCDITLLVSNKKMYAHKLVLASVSEYFQNAIYGDYFMENGQNELELKEETYEILSKLVDYMYTGEIEITSENVSDIYKAAGYYFLNYLKEICLDFLRENLNKENCVKIWGIAHNCKHEKLMIAAGNFIFSNMTYACNTKEFLNLSNEELSDFFQLLPKHELFDSFVTSVLQWTVDKDNCEETVVQILKDISHTSISDDYLENYLSKNEFIQNSNGCHIWMLNIYKEKLKSENKKIKLKQTESEAELKFTRFLYDHPIIFMNSYGNDFYKYNRRDDTFNLYNTIKNVRYPGSDCVTYKNWIYVIRENNCDRFAFDDLHNGYELAFEHLHGIDMSTAVLNDSMYIFGGNNMLKQGSIIDLNTKTVTNFSLLHYRAKAGVAVSDGTIYIFGGDSQDNAERFDPREGKTTHFGSIPFEGRSYFCSAATLSNKIYCTNGSKYKMLDLRNINILDEMKPPIIETCTSRLVSSHGKLYAYTGYNIYKYNHTFKKWKNLGCFPNLSAVKAISFE